MITRKLATHIVSEMSAAELDAEIRRKLVELKFIERRPVEGDPGNAIKEMRGSNV